MSISTNRWPAIQEGILEFEGKDYLRAYGVSDEVGGDAAKNFPRLTAERTSEKLVWLRCDGVKMAVADFRSRKCRVNCEFIGVKLTWRIIESKTSLFNTALFKNASVTLRLRFYDFLGRLVRVSNAASKRGYRIEKNEWMSEFVVFNIPSGTYSCSVEPLTRLESGCQISDIEIYIQKAKRSAIDQAVETKVSCKLYSIATSGDKTNAFCFREFLKDFYQRAIERNSEFGDRTEYTPDGHLRHVSGFRPSFYLGYLGLEGLPQVNVSTGIVNIEVECHAERYHTARIQILSADENGRIIEGLEPIMLKFRVPGGNSDFILRHENLVLDPRTRILYINPKMTVARDIDIIDIRIDEIGICQEELIGEDVSEFSNRVERCITSETVFPSSSNSNNIVEKAIEINISNIVEPMIVNRKLELVPLAEDFDETVGNFLPQLCVFTSTTGEKILLTASVCDLCRINFCNGQLTLRFSLWHAGERSLELVGEADNNYQINRNYAFETPTRLRDKFKLAFNTSPNIIAALNWQPYGYLAAMIFTEHADQQSVETEKLVMYGNSLGNYQEGKGLIGNEIPISKSVFACGHLNQEGEKRVNSLQFEPFYNQIKSYKEYPRLVELGLHTFGHRSVLAKEGKLLLESFSSLGFSFWIDHARSWVKNCLTRAGLDSSRDDYYIGDLLLNKDIRISWSYRDSKFKSLNTVSATGSNNLFFSLEISGNGKEGENRDMAFFSTTRVDFKPGVLDYLDLDQLLAERGVSLVHCYFSVNKYGHIVVNEEVKKSDLGIIFSEGVPAALSEWFNDALQRVAKYRNDGALYVGLLSDWGSYVENVREVTIEQKGNLLIFSNPLEESIPGFSFSWIDCFSGESRTVKVGKEIVKAKHIENKGGDVFIISFDLATGETVAELIM